VVHQGPLRVLRRPPPSLEAQVQREVPQERQKPVALGLAAEEREQEPAGLGRRKGCPSSLLALPVLELMQTATPPVLLVQVLAMDRQRGR
jgi:hypothetical protein